ncbi:hypothetical protein [Aldersonia kunmingensis]|uniref:hypothetical protein n=1 Tax=Aldersonia kunmingensis TaxID=408066 RepID=UPI000833478A|nr:hypothetical protein [Aldersonia kunmingensis]
MTTSIAESSAALPLIAEVSARALQIVTTARTTSRGTPGLDLHPLPPLERFQRAAAEMTHWFAQHAIESEIQGRPGSGVIDELVDDWCSASPWPRDWPQPGPVPVLDLPVRPETADPQLVRAGRIVGALVLAGVGSRLPTGDLGTAMLRGAERLSEAALAG